MNTPAYGSNFLTFDDLRSKLILDEQRLKFLKSKDVVAVQHQALATSVAFFDSIASNQNTNRGNGYRKGKGCNHIYRKGNKNQGGGQHNSNPTQHHSASQSVPTGHAYCNTAFHGLVFNVHLLLILRLFLQVTIHLKGSKALTRTLYVRFSSPPGI